MADSLAEFSSLAEFAGTTGKPVPCEGNLPIELNDPEIIWFVDSGSVNLFLIELKDGVEQAAPQHLLSREAGALLPGVLPDVEEQGTSLSIVAKGTRGTVLKSLQASSLRQINPSETAAQFESWIAEFSGMLARYVSPRLQKPTIAAIGQTQTYQPGTLSARRGVVWVSRPPQGTSLFLDLVDPMQHVSAEDTQVTPIPLTHSSRITLVDEATISASSTESLIQEGVFFQSLHSFHQIAFALERLNRQLAVVDDTNLDRARTTSRRMAEKVARQRLFNIYDRPIERTDSSSQNQTLGEALEIIGDHQGIEFQIPSRSTTSETPVSLGDVLDTSNVRARRVKLDEQTNWWRGDSNPMLAFRREDQQPVALLPSAFGRYRQFDPATKQSVRLNAQRAAALQSEAWVFYPPLPVGDVESKDLLKIAMHGSTADVVRLILAGLPGGLIKLLPAVALGFVVNLIAAGGTSDALYVLAISLCGFALLGALLHVFQGTAMMRIEGRGASRLEAAFWDRLIRLPSNVLQRHPAGDLAVSGMTFQQLRDGVQGVVADSFLSTIFLLPVFGLVFFYDVSLGLTTLLFSLVALLTVLGIAATQSTPHGRLIATVRRVSGRLFQIIGGISKLRVENAEGSAFDIWARDYREQKRAELQLGMLASHAKAFGAALPFLAAGAILYVLLNQADRAMQLAMGDFLVVFTVFMTFQATIARLGESLGVVTGMLPAFQQMRPILSAIPETTIAGDSVEYLGGDLLFDRVTFHYDHDSPPVLDDVTIHARPGEFVAIAGESGAGKSTLFRLALGLERPTAGAVYYDGRDLRHLNLKQLRKKIGAVPQSVGLHPQDLWDNFVSHHENAENDEVWEAARVAIIEDEIKKMPMGMMTMVGTSGSVLSGGESQRITIARSVMGNPTLMLFDEATNWLDNENQAAIMNNLTTLTATRIVIAHRLSTLEKADRIYVMQAGKVVQIGSFEELVTVDGVFKNLVQRQIV